MDDIRSVIALLRGYNIDGPRSFVRPHECARTRAGGAIAVRGRCFS